jgi:hypothetical protein
LIDVSKAARFTVSDTAFIRIAPVGSVMSSARSVPVRVMPVSGQRRPSAVHAPVFAKIVRRIGPKCFRRSSNPVRLDRF